MSFAPSPAGKEPGTFVWRIESFKPVEYPKKQYGKFYTGDSYLVLHSAPKGGGSGLIHVIYYWLGAESSQDEKGAAALLAVELDDAVAGGAAAQVRELCGSESAGFRALFAGRLQLLEGGVASGFTSAAERGAFEPRLFRVKGSRHAMLAQVPLSAGSLNSGDVFVLQLAHSLWQWNGSGANRKEKAKALDVTLALRAEEHGGKAVLEVVDEGSEPAAFWEALGGKKPLGAALPDDGPAALACRPRIFRTSDAAGGLQTAAVPYEGALPSKGALSSADVFLVDCGSELFAWVGRGASATERAGAVGTAERHLAKEARRGGVAVQKVSEGAEPVAFKHKFRDFGEPAPLPTFGSAGAAKGAPSPARRGAAELASGMLRAAAAQSGSPAPGAPGGETTVYRVADFALEAGVRFGGPSFGSLCTGDCYLVLHERGSGAPLIYIWQGAAASQDEKGASALLAARMDEDRFGGGASQVRVEQGHEPAHFVALFHGKLLLMDGGRASAFTNVNGADGGAEAEAAGEGGACLYQVKGHSAHCAHGAQVPLAARSLNSGDCFLLSAPGYAAVWNGAGATAAEREVAAGLAKALAPDGPVASLEEGAEGADFWAQLGGKAEYARTKPQPADAQAAPPRLFEISERTGRLAASEVVGFAQQDLSDDEAFLLDSLDSLFVWLGSRSSAAEREGAVQLAAAYLEAAGRPKTPVVTVKAGSEPLLFTSHFLGWRHDAPAPFVDPYEARLAKLRAEKLAQPAAPKANGRAPPAPAPAPSPQRAPPAPEPAAPRPSATSYAPPGSLLVPLAQLTAGSEPRADPTCKERYLSDAEFEAALGIGRGAFEGLKGWKQAELKKKAGLF